MAIHLEGGGGEHTHPRRLGAGDRGGARGADGDAEVGDRAADLVMGMSMLETAGAGILM